MSAAKKAVLTYLIVAAMPEEIEGLKKYIPLQKYGCEAGELLANDPKDPNYHVIVIQGGIGKVAMASTLTKYLQAFVDTPIEVINIGVAGSISPKLKKLQTLVATKTAYHDVDVTAFGYQKGQMAGMPLYFDCDPEKVALAKSLDPENVVTGLILSGDSFIGKNQFSPSWFKDFDDPLACDMESAAVGQVCHNYSIPFMIIRSISDDTTQDDNKETYDQLLVKASAKAGELVFNLINDK